MKIRILPEAERDIEEAFFFFESRTKGLGYYFLDSITADIDSLAWFGGIHRKVYNSHRLITKRFPFAVYYKITDEVVVVQAVLDCRRNPTWIRYRLQDI